MRAFLQRVEQYEELYPVVRFPVPISLPLSPSSSAPLLYPPSPIRAVIEHGFQADKRTDVRLYFGVTNADYLPYQVTAFSAVRLGDMADGFGVAISTSFLLAAQYLFRSRI